MTYRRSRARREFESQLKQSVAELSSIYEHANASGAGDRLLAAYFVFIYSQFEVYIKAVVEDSVASINDTAPPLDKWPDLMLGYFLHRSENLGADYRRYAIDDDEGMIIKKVALAARKISAWSKGNVSMTPVESPHFLDKKKYPSPKNLPQLFKRLGIEKVFDVISREGKMSSQLVVISLNDLRTEIAHEGRIPQGFSLPDLKNKVLQMKRFVAALDRSLSKHFCPGVIRRSDWNRLMC